MNLTREQWLEQATELMRPWLDGEGAPLPEKILVSCGFTKGKGNDKGIGQCFDAECCEEKVYQIFISPCQEETTRVLDILLHELIHAAVGIKEGHKGRFKSVATNLGLTGKMTATVCEEGSELHSKLLKIQDKLGKYPHSALVLKKQEKGEKKKTNSWIRLQSTYNNKYRITISAKMLEEHGNPLDPWGKEMEEIES
jgi:hypothetical protein